MSRVRPDTVSHLAALARLELSGEQLEAAARDLDRLVQHVAKLQAVDTTGVAEDEWAPAEAAPLREDRARPPGPDVEARFFRVPKVLDRDADAVDDR